MHQGILLKSYLEQSGVSVSELSRKLNISRAAINNYFRTETFQESTYVNILSALGITKDDFESYRPLNIEVKQVDFEDFMAVPIVSINAQAGYLNSIAENDAEFMNELETILVPREFEKGYYLVIEVNGDSMDDGTSRSICAGDKLLCQELQKHHWGNRLHFRQYLFVIVSNEGIVCKQITEHDTINGTVKCHSFNDSFHDYTLNFRDVYQIFYVKKIVERRLKF